MSKKTRKLLNNSKSSYTSKLLNNSKSSKRSTRSKKTKRSKPSYKYSVECINNNLLELLNNKSNNWNETTHIKGITYVHDKKLNIQNATKIIHDSFTNTILKQRNISPLFNNKNNKKTIIFEIGDKIQIWIIVNKKKKLQHAACVIWNNEIPYSFGFINNTNNDLVLNSPDFELEKALIRQYRMDPTLKKGHQYCKLLAMGKLTQNMIDNLDLFLSQSQSINKLIIIEQGFRKNKLNTLSTDFILSTYYKDYEPHMIPFITTSIKGKEYCLYDKSRKNSKFNCLGSLDTIFKEIFSCRMYGTYVHPKFCKTKEPCYF